MFLTRRLFLVVLLIILVQGMVIAGDSMGTASIRVFFEGRNVSAESEGTVFSESFYVVGQLDAAHNGLTGVLPEGDYIVVVRYEGVDKLVEWAELEIQIIAGGTVVKDVTLSEYDSSSADQKQDLPSQAGLDDMFAIEGASDAMGGFDMSEVEDMMGGMEGMAPMEDVDMGAFFDMGGLEGMYEMMEGMEFMEGFDMAEMAEMMEDMEDYLGSMQEMQDMMEGMDFMEGLEDFDMEGLMDVPDVPGMEVGKEEAEEVLKQDGPIPPYGPFPSGYEGYYVNEVRISIGREIENIDDHVELINILRTGTVDERRQGSERLVQIGEPAIPMLIVLLGDEDPELRADAAYILAKKGDDQARSALEKLMLLFEDEYWRARANAIYALEKTGWDNMEAATDKFFKALEDNDGRVRAAAISAINGHAVYYEKLRRHLVDWSHESALLFSETLSDDHPGVRYGAVILLRDAGPYVGTAVPGLVSVITDPNARVAAEALNVLERAASDAGVRPEDIAIALEDDRPEVLRAAGSALARIGHGGADILMQALKSPRVEVRQAAANNLRLMSDMPPESVVIFADLLSDPDVSVRRDASLALAKGVAIEQIDAITEQLLGAVDDSDYYIRSRIIRILGNADPVANPDLIPTISEALMNDETATVRTSAAEAMGQLGAEQTIPYLIEALSDGHSGVMIAAAEALGSMGEKAHLAVEELGSLLTQRSAPLARAGIQAMADIGVSSIPVMIELLDHPEWTTRLNAMLALDKMGEHAAPAIDKLQYLSENDEEEMVRGSAANLIKKIEEAIEAAQE